MPTVPTYDSLKVGTTATPVTQASAPAYIDQAGNVLMTQIDNRKDRRPPGAKFDGAKMFWFMRVVGGVGMHEGYLPGYADSHGCIRLPSGMARTFYQNAPLGTPVRIVE
jgi:hypothetical protein